MKRKAYDEPTTFLQWSSYKYNTNADETYVRLVMFNSEDYKVARFQVFGQSTFEVALNDDDWHDMKIIYYAAQQKAECYYDEELVHTFTVTIAKNALLLNMRGVRRTGSDSANFVDARNNGTEQLNAKSNSVGRINQQAVQGSSGN